ncbi:MAG: S41 family peptidase [Chloroflexota bacterium]
MKSTKQSTGVIRPILTGATLGVLLAGVFVLGFYVRGLFPDPVHIQTVPIEEAGYPLIDEVQGLIDQIYLREQPDYISRQYGAIRGMLSTLEDPNTFFIDPPVARSEADALAGTYGGIGVLVNLNELGQFVVYPFDDSPAIEAGIQQGAILVAINGTPISIDNSLDSVDQMLRGEVIDDNGVEVTVRQNDEELTVFIAFDVINVPSVIWRVTDDDTRIGYVQLLRFTARTPEELETALQELNQTDVEALIIDMRNNSGGLLDESIDVASEFINRSVVIYEVTQDSERTFNAEQGGLATDIPLAVLVNNRTASAAELVAGAIRDNDRGILIGQRTFGKGTVQQIFALSDGSSVHITSAEWFTPDRTPIAGVGLIPDIEMIPDENGRDVEYGEAIRYLQTTLETE